MNIVCFHNPDEDNGYLSNWYPSSFTVDGVAFSSMEQFMMYRKAICFGDEAVAAQILSTSDVAKIKSLGRQVSNYDESMWNGIRQIVVYEGLLAKFSQNEELKAKLKVTGNAVLAECAVKDRIWGIGLSMKDPDRLNKAKWNGQNLLGYALMMVRERLQQDYSWEQRKVSELFRVTRGYVLAATQTETTKIDENPYPVYSSQTKDKGLMGYYKDYLYEDAITWTTDGANAGTVNYRAGKFYCTNVCGVLLSNEVKANQMIAEALNSVAKGYVSYVGNPKLMNNVMADIVIQIPTQAEEREQLSSFFAKLDNLITLHQRELYKYLRYRILKVRRKS